MFLGYAPSQRSTSIAHKSSNLASQPSSCSHGCASHFDSASRDASKETEWLRRVSTISMCISNDRWYGTRMSGTEVTNFSIDHVSHNGSSCVHCQPFALQASKKRHSIFSITVFILWNCFLSFKITESSSDIDFSMSLICGLTIWDCGCLSGGTRARELLRRF